MEKREGACRWHEIVEHWPRYEDGLPVWFGDKLPEFDSTIYKTVKSITIQENGRAVIDNAGGSANVNVVLKSGERVRRPEPKVLDADGVEVEVGDDLYTVGGMFKFHVSAIDKKSGRIATEAMFALDKWADPKMLTHRAPVIAADGVPISEGETVFMKGNGRRGVVKGFDGPWALVEYDAHDVNGATMTVRTDGACLTHTKPEIDTWERIEEDARLKPTEYTDRYRVGRFGFESEDMRADLVRRCRALAERGE